MKKTTNLKALVLSMIMTLGLVMPLTAQRTDDFFKSNNDDIYEDRGGATFTGNGIDIEQFGAPLGSGLLIMVAAGAGYAVARRRRSIRKSGAMLLALAMILTFTQCKKRIETINPTQSNNGGVHVTLRVDNNSKHDINITDNIGKITFDDGDQLWVINGSQIVGMLTYGDVDPATGVGVFSGTIGIDVTTLWTNVFHTEIELDPDDYLYFCYFASQDEPGMDIDNNRLEIAIGLIDQRQKLPLVSMGQTTYKYGYYVENGGLDDLSCTLRNKCALVKFVLPSETAADVVLTNVCTSVDFDIYKGEVGFYPNHEYAGMVTLYNPSAPNASDVRWGVLCPNDAVNAHVLIGNTAYENAVAIPALQNNQLIDDTHNNGPLQIRTSGPQAELNKRTFYNPITGSWLEMAKGNLVYSISEETFSTVANAYDLVEANGTVNYSATGQDNVSLFGWGAWGKTGSNIYNTSTTSSEYIWSGDIPLNAVIEGKTGWRTMTEYEANYLFEGREKYYSATVNGVHGIILLSDRWNGEINDKYGQGFHGWSNVEATSAQWSTLESAGALFLPYTGMRHGTSVSNVNNTDPLGGEPIVGWTYWTSGYSTEGDMPYSLTVYNDKLKPTKDSPDYFAVYWMWAAEYGIPVRPVRDITFTTPSK